MRSLFSSVQGLPRPEFRQLPFPHYHLTLSELMYVHGLTEKSLSSYRIVQVVRNPLNRFVSAWKHQERILGKTMALQALLEKLAMYKCLLPDKWEEFYRNFYEDPQHREKSFARGNWGGLRFYMDQVDWNDVNRPVH
ncbi:sulfotransferase family 2 domain-containing protein [Lunatimonas lonarensis]|uniref:sulfotransferase family 2 domain-containing protein n=1 Tax=Lunatimonas lonarensis TaxID=1232681 RepID=UPI0004BB3FC0|nr:sulfotransferase family 2 domain-containing protein [Lunatimonas lonarensis]